MININITKRLAEFELSLEMQAESLPLAIFGHSGAGKSTILRCVAGLEKPDNGNISINGSPVFDSSSRINVAPEKRRIGYVPQNSLLFPHLNVRQNLEFGANRNTESAQSVAFDRVVEILDLGDLLKRSTHKLSGGERQRVALGRALLASPLLLLFDEPLASVDSRLKHRILAYLIRAIDYFGIPAIYVSHDQNEVTQIARNILVLKQGKKIALGSYLDIIDDPRVYEQFSREEINNPFAATHLGLDSTEGYSLVRAGEATFKIPPVHQPEGILLNLNIKANDIILATEKPHRISTRNVLEGTVTRIADVGRLSLVHINIGCEVVVEITPSAMQELDLSLHEQVWVLMKTNSFQIIR